MQVRDPWFDKLTMRESVDATIIVNVAETGPNHQCVRIIVSE